MVYLGAMKQQPSPEEQAKELVRELRGLIKDGQQLKREMAKLHVEIHDDTTKAAEAVVHPVIADLEQELIKYREELEQALDKSNRNFQQSIADFARVKSPEAFMRQLITVLHENLENALMRAVEQRAQEIVKEYTKSQIKKRPTK